MKLLKLKIANVSGAHEAGAGLRKTIIQHGLNENTVKHIKRIFMNHSSSKLLDFLTGLFGVGKNGQPSM